jgi:hypothetical protein
MSGFKNRFCLSRIINLHVLLLFFYRKILLDVEENEKERFVLMQRFKPIIYENYIVKPNTNGFRQEFISSKVSNELGIFGVLVR